MMLISFISTGLNSCGKMIKVERELAFCDAEEKRDYSIEELKMRSQLFPENLKKDFKTNKTGQRECGWEFEKTT